MAVVGSARERPVGAQPSACPDAARAEAAVQRDKLFCAGFVHCAYVGAQDAVRTICGKQVLMR